MLPTDILALILSFAETQPDHVSKSFETIAKLFKKRCESIESNLPFVETEYVLELHVYCTENLTQMIQLDSWSISCELVYYSGLFRNYMEVKTRWFSVSSQKTLSLTIHTLDEMYFDIRTTAPRSIENIPDFFILPYMMRSKSRYHSQVIPEGRELCYLTMEFPYSAKSVLKYLLEQ